MTDRLRYEKDGVRAWADLRIELTSRLIGMLGETSVRTALASAIESGSLEPFNVDTVVSREQNSAPRTPTVAANKQPNTRARIRIYERAIIRDLPGVAEFATMSSGERQAHPEINRLMSIAAGVISRGKAKGISDRYLLHHALWYGLNRYKSRKSNEEMGRCRAGGRRTPRPAMD